MKKLRVYVETSVIGGYFDEEFKIPTRKLFELFRNEVYKAVISEHTVNELYRAPDNVKTNLETVNYEKHETNDEMYALSDKYMAENIVSEKYHADALHIAIATILGVDILVSWNFKHIVNFNRIRLFNAVNLREGYGILDIRTPSEVIGDEEKKGI